VVVVIGVGSAVVAGKSGLLGSEFGTAGRSAGPKAVALAHARSVVDATVPPPGSRPVGSAPTPQLSKPASMLVSPHVVSRTRFWTVRGTLASVGAYFRRHHENGRAAEGQGSLSDRSGLVSSFLTYGELQIEIAPIGTRTVGIRADAIVLWEPDKPAAERIPGGVRSVDLLAYQETPDNVVARRTVTGAAARHLADLANALARDNRGVHGCGGDRGRRTRITFSTSQGPAVLDGFFCGSVELTVRGQVQPPLLLSKGLDAAVTADLRVRTSGPR